MSISALRHDQLSSRPHGAAPPRDAPEADFDLVARLDPRETAFFFDVDGTLIDIAAHPDAVEVPAPLAAHIEALSGLAGGALALVSGREAAVLDRLFAPLSLALSGVHGAQMRRSPKGEVESPTAAMDAGVRMQLRDLAARLGLHAEDKGWSVALHYRDRPSVAADLEEDIARILAGHARTLTVLPGRMVFEVKNRGHDKGAAVRAFMAEAPFAGRSPVFFGDDVTDEAGFAAVRELGGLAVSVGRRLPGADAVLADAEMVRALIRHVVQSAEGRA
ncbi:MAG: trehalose-phosphatase [Azorhizobium sp. 39-67-5]|nr:MAG: trehalose-phosphatase [Rhizobiales bacterium 35-68-8]OZA91747.1 MAG: trehalose-phosphatase [Azorhizobium sp. 39-67-5]